MRKPGLPILKVRFPDGSDRPYWNTFYQEVIYKELSPGDLLKISGISADQAAAITKKVNAAIQAKRDFKEIDFGSDSHFRDDVIAIVESKRNYLGQMDLNAGSKVFGNFTTKP